MGQSQVTKALLSGEPSGFWHLTVGNPLDPIAMMGNMAVKSTKVQFSEALGYDDFPTEIKFSVELEHARPRDNGDIQSMFNGGKGRFYAFTNSDMEKAYHSIDTMRNFQSPTTHQKKNVDYDNTTWEYNFSPEDPGQGTISAATKGRMRQIGSLTN